MIEKKSKLFAIFFNILVIIETIKFFENWFLGFKNSVRNLIVWLFQMKNFVFPSTLKIMQF